MSILSAKQFGMRDDGVSDNTSVFNALLKECKASGDSVFIDRGSYLFKSKPVDIDFGLTMYGAGPGMSCLVRGYKEAEDKGFLNFTGGNQSISNLGLIAARGTDGGYGIALISPENNSPDYSVFDNLYISGVDNSGRWNSAFIGNGTKRLSAPGLRDITIRNCNMFASSSKYVLQLHKVNNAWISGGFFSAGGVGDSILICDNSNNITCLPNYCLGVDIKDSKDIVFISSSQTKESVVNSEYVYIKSTRNKSLWERFKGLF